MKNDIFFTTDVPYNKRQYILQLAESSMLQKAIDSKTTDLELCVLAGNSNSIAGSWFQTQCRQMPPDFGVLQKENFAKTLATNVYGKHRNSRRRYNSSAVIFKSNFMKICSLIVALYSLNFIYL